jgi:hypothetical protein
VKAQGLTLKLQSKLVSLSTVEAEGIPGGEVKFVDIGRKAKGESTLLGRFTDTDRRKLGERKGLDTPVVLAVNDGY